MSSRKVFTYTTAPADYDWFGTTTVRVAGHDKRGRPIRKVSSDPKYLQSQRDRYASGLHMAVDEAEWKKLVSYKLVTTGELAENPLGIFSGMGLLTLAAGAGVAWWLLRPKKAAAASNPVPALPPASQAAPAVQVPVSQGPLPPPPAPIPPQPLPNCAGKIVQEYKFANQAPSIQVFRRLYIWDTSANQNYTSFVDQGFAPATTGDLFGLLNLTTGVVMPSGFVESMGLDLVMRLVDARKVPLTNPHRYAAEAWLKTIDGWCLRQVATNYEPWTGAFPPPPPKQPPPPPPGAVQGLGEAATKTTYTVKRLFVYNGKAWQLEDQEGTFWPPDAVEAGAWKTFLAQPAWDVLWNVNPPPHYYVDYWLWGDGGWKSFGCSSNYKAPGCGI